MRHGSGRYVSAVVVVVVAAVFFFVVSCVAMQCPRVDWCLQSPWPRLQNPAGKYIPVEIPEYHAAPCERCPKNLSAAPRAKGATCRTCGAEFLKLMDIPSELLEVPELTFVSH